MNPISAYAFMIFNLFSAPCFGAIGAMARELGSRRKMLKVVIFQTTYAWLIATLFYQISSRINGINIANIVIISILILISNKKIQDVGIVHIVISVIK